MRELVVFVAKALVDKSDEVTVEELQKDDVVVEELRVAKDDLGKVIGKQGRTAKAIRTVLTAAAAKLDKKVRLEIVE
ncbi:MAG: KH domain-containing protein [Proteobacteria bacterium]|nr:KH domain-containing protein [Desulfobulbaceae bacterium]MBU4151406.1 KH domain-containing protein [Pseudomonadota bacterium]